MTHPAIPPPALEATDVSLNYGGVKALNQVSLTAAPAAITGLIGPNGSGKSSFINIVSGAYRGPYQGSVQLSRTDLRNVRPTDRPRLGMSRIFQGIRLFDTLTVEENILLGAHTQYSTGMLAGFLRTGRARRDAARQRARAREVMALFGPRLLPRSDHQVLSLSYANRRRVELARALMSKPSFLLLDEPMAGMNPHETEELTQQLLGFNTDDGIGMLLVEHKMSVIGDLCSDVYVLDHGVVIAHGSADAVQQDPNVVEAFLG
jgi:branched-chain amino acid transport system permease protein